MINTILFILLFGNNPPSHLYVISFEKSTCDTPISLTPYDDENRNRIIDSTYQDSTLSIKIDITANCGIGTTNNVQLLGDTLELLYGSDLYPKYGPVEEGGGYASSFTFCDCKFTLSYLIANISPKPYHIKIREVENDWGEVIEKSPYRYKSKDYPEGLSVDEYKKSLAQNLEIEKVTMDLILRKLEEIVDSEKDDKAEGKTLTEHIDEYIELRDTFIKHKDQYFGYFIQDILGEAYVKTEQEAFITYMQGKMEQRSLLIDQMEAQGIDFWKELAKREEG